MANRRRYYLFLMMTWVFTIIVAQTYPVGALNVMFQGNFGTQQTFDALDIMHKDAHKYKTNEAGGLAWAESYIMMSYVAMYEATSDTKYLDKLISHADAVMRNRDSERGVLDYRGLSLPGWTASTEYSIGEIELLDDAQTPTLYLSVASTGSNNMTRVTVTPAENPNYFNLTIENATNKYKETFSNITMNPSDARYAVKVIGASKLSDPWGAVRLKVRDLNSDVADERRNPVAVSKFMNTPAYLWPVHQGMITYPMMAFARFVHESPTLQANPVYKAKADWYVQEVEKLMLLLDADWRENEQGEGWYAVEQGAPVWMDGVDEPFNHFLAVGRTMVHLAAVTGNPLWHDRVEKMARVFKNDLVLKNGAYTWQYWWSKGYGSKGWSPKDQVSLNTPALQGRTVAEDISHGAIDLHFAYLCYRDNIVFDREDMVRFAKTFTQNMLTTKPDGKPTLFQRVDGGGSKTVYDIYARHFVLLAEFDRQILTVYEELFRDTPWSGNTMYMLTSANMNLVKKRMSQQ